MGFEVSIYKTFKPIINSFILPFFKDIDRDLRRARINKSLEEYLGMTFFYSLLFSIVFIFLAVMFVLFLYTITKNQKVFIILPVLSLLGGLFGFILGIVLFRLYPSMIASTRARKIDNALYIATIYMTTVASSGANPLALFTLLAQYKEFGEISKEAQDIVYYVKVLGLDLPTALHLKAQYSPSKNWKELLEGIRSIITEGGNLEAYLYEKAQQFIQEHKRKLIEYTNMLQVMLELYITLIIVGVIFILILTTLMGAIGGNVVMIKQIQLLIVLVALPMFSVMFMLLLKAINPFES